MTTRRVHFAGTDHNGVACGGAGSVASVAAFVQVKFARGFQNLQVWSAYPRAEVGGIRVVSGRRTWWAEK